MQKELMRARKGRNFFEDGHNLDERALLEKI
jgi:hypothetical protein